VDRIALKEFPSFPVIVPNLSRQKEIADSIELIRSENQRLESLYQTKLDALDELKKSLLHQAFSGTL